MQIHVTTLVDGAGFRHYQCCATICHWHQRLRPVQYTDPWLLLQAVGAQRTGHLLVDGNNIPTLAIPKEGSQRFRHQVAYEGTTTDLYVLTDDDILPFPTREKYGEPWYDYVEDVFVRHPRLAMAQPFLLNENTTPYGLSEVIPCRAIGGCRIIRREAVTDMLNKLGDFPPMIPTKRGAYDAAITEALGDGWFCGTISKWWADHAGRPNGSTVAPRGYHALTENPL